MANLYDKAGLVNIPVGYQDGFLYNIKPEDNTLGFRFNRDSAATRVNKEGLIEQVGYFGPELVQNGNFSELGPELVVNGDFATDSDWTKGAGWSIANGKLLGTLSNSTNAYQAKVLEAGKIYQITYEISNYSQGGVRFQFAGGGSTVSGTSNFSNGVFTEKLKATVNHTSVRFRSLTTGGGFTGSIDNVSVKQVDPNDYWSLVSGSWSFGDNKIIGGGSGIFKPTTNSWTSGGKFLFKLKISDRTSGYIRIENPAVTVYYVNNIDENGELQFIFDSIDDTGWAIEAQGGFNGSITDISVTEILGDKPRIDYTDSLISPSLLLEPQSTNLITFSEDFSNSSWIKNSTGTGTNPILDFGYISPDGSVNATKITFNIGAGSSAVDLCLFKTNISAINGVATIYLKGNTGGEDISFLAGNTRENIILTNSWKRYTLSSTSLSQLVLRLRGDQSTNKSCTIYVWGAQVEQKSYATSYIPTAGSTVTRAQETCIDAGNVSTFNSTEGVLYAEISSFKNGGIGDRTISINDGSTQNAIQLLLHNTANRINFRLRSGGSLDVNISDFTFEQNQTNKIACKYKLGDYALWINGEEKATSSSSSLPSGLSVLSFNDGSIEDFYGKTRSLLYFNRALTDTELADLTT